MPMRPSVLSLALGYVPVVILCILAVMWYDTPLWLAALGVFLGGPVATLAVAALRSAPELRRRSGWRRSDTREEEAPGGRTGDQGNTR